MMLFSSAKVIAAAAAVAVLFPVLAAAQTESPTGTPTAGPTGTPTATPTAVPTGTPSATPSEQPTSYSVRYWQVGESGKFKIFRGPDENTTEFLMVTFDNLEHINATTGELMDSCDTANGRHQLTTFAKVPFEFTFFEEEDEYGGLAAEKLEFEATLDWGIVLVQVLLFKQGGDVVNGPEETFNVVQGDLKFNIELKNWTWCAPGEDETVELRVEIKSKEENQISQVGNVTYDVGGVSLLMSEIVNVDGNSTSVTPIVETQGSKLMFTVPFPKFTENATYDPIVGLGDRSIAGPEFGTLFDEFGGLGAEGGAKTTGGIFDWLLNLLGW